MPELTSHGGSVWMHPRYGYIRNHKKTIKNKQARTRERKNVQNPEAKARKKREKRKRGTRSDNWPSQAAYMTLTGAWKKEIWLKGLLAESGYELSLVAGIATGALVKGGSRSWFQHRSTDTLRLLTNEQKAFRDNLRKSGVGYNGSCVLSQAYAKIPKLYRAYELCDKNEQLHVFDSEETLEDAEKSQLKMNEFQKDEKIQELKIQPIDYEKLNKLYKEFVPQKQLSEPSVKQTCSSPYSIPFVKILETKTMPSELPLINELFNIKVGFEKLSLLIHHNSKRESIFYTSKAEIERNDFCREKVKPLLNELQVYFDDFQNLFQRDIKEMKDAFEQNDVYLDEIENQNVFGLITPSEKKTFVD
ncbi:hypothetical protein Tco_0911568 [Tanacetum coccineum]|uniref:Uncharacterized protein n=1 Tax=Tanacetum coccineum TaxID=301880 RepID=A0ABQ5CYD0_9ASTR